MEHKLAKKLNSFSVFRESLRDPLIHAAQTLLMSGKQNFQEAYCDFAAALCQNGGDFSEYLKRLLDLSENMLIRKRAAKKTLTAHETDALLFELNTLSELSEISPEWFEDSFEKDVFYPKWETKKIDLTQYYLYKMRHLSREGFGIFSVYHAFRFTEQGIQPVKNPDPQSEKELFGYEAQRKKVFDNTYALLKGKPVNNILLYGDAGTGKSSTVKAALNRWKNHGLRLIEIPKNLFDRIPELTDKLAEYPLKFLLFIDDLSFSENETNFSALKAVLEGSVAAKGRNCVIYATSNRRHLVKENGADRTFDDLHANDTLQEVKSLSDRFGIVVTFQKPEKDEFLEIVSHLAKQYRVAVSDMFFLGAEAFALRNGGRTPRVAKHYVEAVAAGVLKN